MVQILQANPTKGRGFLESIVGGLSEGIPEAVEQYQKKKAQASQISKENEQLKKMGIDLAGITDPKMRQEAFAQAFQSPLHAAQTKKIQQEMKFAEDENQDFSAFNFEDPSSWSDQQIDKFRGYAGPNAKGKTLARTAENEFKKREQTKKVEEKNLPFESAIEVVDRMRQIRKKGNLGVGAGLSFLPETQKDATEYSRLGKSLIALSSTIPIRNQKEFDVLANELFDPSITDAKAEGLLNAMEQIINSSIRETGGSKAKVSSATPTTPPKEKRDLKSFYK